MNSSSIFWFAFMCVLHDAISSHHGDIKLLHQSDRFTRFSTFCLSAQKRIIAELEEEETFQRFCSDHWEKSDTSGTLSGYGTTSVIQRGELIEKGAVSTTILTGLLSKERAAAMIARRGKDGDDMSNCVGKTYFACALSLVLHSKSPMVPTFRADIRYFEVPDGRGWFGGGADLTPYYLFDEDIREFHALHKTNCDQFSTDLYPRLKQWCDEYFYIPARNEHRGGEFVLHAENTTNRKN